MKNKYTIPIVILFFLIEVSSLYGGETLLIGFHANFSNWSQSELGIPANRNRQLIVTAGGPMYGTSGASVEATPGGKVVYSSGWDNGSGTKGWIFPMTTTKYQNLTFNFYHRSRKQWVGSWESGPRDFKIQYSTNGSSWTDVASTNYTLTANWQQFSFTLPAACNNQATLYLKWVMRSNYDIDGNPSIPSGALNDFADFYLYGDEIPISPSDITLSNNIIHPNTPIGTSVCNLFAVDENTSDTHTFTLVAGSGDTYNSSFTITGNTLKVNALLSAGTYSIRINANDGTLNFSKSMNIVVQAQSPTNITLSNNSVLPSSPIGTTIGTLTATDPNPYDTFTFSFTSGDGDTHNSLFVINGNELKTNADLAEGTYSVRINVNDGSLNYSKSFSIVCGNFYPEISGDNAYDYLINVTLNTINQTSAKNTSGYGDYTGVSTTVNKNETYTLFVTNGEEIYIGYPQRIIAWFDWNKDGDFTDDGEEYIFPETISSQGTYQTSINVPSGANETSTRMRVVVRGANEENTPLLPPNSGNIGYGEAEDYTIIIAGPLPVELTSFTANASESKVLLNWSTATEVNNYGFQVERLSVIGNAIGTGQSSVNENNPNSEIQNPQWAAVGFVEGSGNSNSPKEYSFVDNNPTSGNLQYRLKQIDTDGAFEYYPTLAEVNYNLTNVEEKQLPTEFGLSQNYPNPFNPTTVISFQLSVFSHTVLKVYDLLGNEVAELVKENKQPGYYNVEFNAGNLSTGVYIYKLTAGSYTSTKKLMLVK